MYFNTQSGLVGWVQSWIVCDPLRGQENILKHFKVKQQNFMQILENQILVESVVLRVVPGLEVKFLVSQTVAYSI